MNIAPPVSGSRSDVPESYGRWELTPVGRDCWRLADPAQRHGDAEHVIAFVERTELGPLEVLWLRNPCPRTSRFAGFPQLFEALDDAIAAASDRSRPPRTIRHRPPL